MSTGTDVPISDVMATLAESVERCVSLLSNSERLAGPAATQDEPGELVPGGADGCVGLGLSFADGVAVTIMLAPALAIEFCGGTEADQLRSGLQVLTDELTAGFPEPLVDSLALADAGELVHFLSDRPFILGAGVFEGDAVVATVGAAGAPVGGAAAVPAATVPTADASVDAPEPTADHAAPAAPAAPAASPTPSPAPAPIPAAAQPGYQDLGGSAPASLADALPTVSDDVLARGLALLADVSLAVTAELGRSHLRVSELLSLEPGSVIGLEREAGSPVDVLVNGSLFARAEVIVVDDRYAVRITELLGGRGFA